MSMLHKIDADRIVDWLHDGDALMSSNGFRFTLRDGWTVEIEPDGDIDAEGRYVDSSTVKVSHYSQQVDPGGHEREIHEAADSLRKAKLAPWRW